MAIYHCSVKIIGRSSGRSSVAAAAYRAGQKIKNERDGLTHDYSRKSGVVHSEIMLPTHAPEAYKDRSTLWNAVEKKERRNDSQTAREVEIALLIEFNLEENIQVVQNYINENFVDKGMCADFSIHETNNGNPHAHIMLTMRDVSLDGFGNKNRDWNNVKYLEQWRESWAKECNRTLAEKGEKARIDHRTLEAQGLERTPTIHVGISKARKVQNERIIQSNQIYAPENISLYMNELNEGYVIVKNHINEVNQSDRELIKIESNIKAISVRSDDLRRQYHDLQQAKIERENMGMFKSKREIDAKIDNMERTYKYSRDHFERNFKVSSDQASNEIKRLEVDYQNMIKSRDNADLSRYQEKMKVFEKEYKRQRLLAEIRADGKEIFERLDRADVKLNKVTQEDFREISQELRTSQVAMLESERYNERYNNTKARGIYDFVR